MKKRYDLGLPDLTPDLEWMLSSGQVSSTLLLEKLLQDYYPKISQLAFSILNDRALAERCTQDIFVKAMLSAHKFSSDSRRRNLAVPDRLAAMPEGKPEAKSPPDPGKCSFPSCKKTRC